MLERLRTPFLIAAAIAIVLALGAELGTQLLPPPPVDPAGLNQDLPPGLRLSGDTVGTIRGEQPPRPGWGIPALAMLDCFLVMLVTLFLFALIIPGRIQSRIQGIVSLIVSIVVLIWAFLQGMAAFILLLLMFGLFVAVPFGTLAYLAIWGFFDTGGAGATLAVLLVLKIACGVLLVIAHQRFLLNKGLIALLLTSIVGTVLLSFLHGLVPGVMVSIIDALGAVIIAILAAIWAVILLIGSIVAILKSLRPDPIPG